MYYSARRECDVYRLGELGRGPGRVSAIGSPPRPHLAAPDCAGHAIDLRRRAGDRWVLMTSATKTATRKRPSYSGTVVSATVSREEIQTLLARPDLGITDGQWVALGGRNSRLYFRIEGRLYKIDIHAADTLKDPDKKFRRLHRGVAHLLKNAIAVAEEGLCGVGEILAAFLVTSDENVTVGEALLRLEAGSTRPFTLALAPAETSLARTTKPRKP